MYFLTIMTLNDVMGWISFLKWYLVLIIVVASYVKTFLGSMDEKMHQQIISTA